MTVADIIEKRKKIWNERGDLDYDKAFIRAAAEKILATPELISEVRECPYLLIESIFYVVDKKRATRPFFLNTVQTDFISKLEQYGTKKPFVILKGRQMGFTTLITAMQLCFAIVRKNFAGFTMADRSDNTGAIFNDKARTVYSRLPEILKPSEKFNSRNEMFFDKLNSSWRIATATDQVGRSRTLNFVHFSEVAFYECDLSLLQAGIGEAIAEGAIQIYETTANGFNQFKELWDSESCHNLFFPWWLTPEYRSKEYEYLETNDSWLLKRIEVLRTLGCDKEQITWYCKKYNGYLDKSTIRQEYPVSPEEAFISTGESLFDKEAINNQLALSSSVKPVKRGSFAYKKEIIPIELEGVVVEIEYKIRDIEFIESPDGYITIHEEPMIKTNAYGDITHRAPYAIGGDTAGTGKDYFTAKVECVLNDKTVATLRKQYIDEDLYAEQVYCLGKYYHDALIGIEINYSRQPTRILQKYEYPNLYMRERLDGITDKPVLDYGFETTRHTKPVIIGELVELMRQSPSSECDVETLKEMSVFVRKEHGKMEAIDGCHDDLVIAKAIAHHVAKKQAQTWIAAEGEGSEFIEDNFSMGTAETSNEAYMSWEDF